MYTIKRRHGPRIKEYYYYTEDEAIQQKISYHANPCASFKKGEISLNNYILTIEGLVVPVIGINRKQGVLSIPTNVITQMSSKPVVSIKAKDGSFKFSVELTESQKKYSVTIKNIIDVFLKNGFDHIEAVNSVLGELTGSGKSIREIKRANDYFLREETQEYLRMTALQHFIDAGIQPSDIIGKMFESLGRAVDKDDYEHVEKLGGMLLVASGEYNIDGKPTSSSPNTRQPRIAQESTKETKTLPIGIVSNEEDLFDENED